MKNSILFLMLIATAIFTSCDKDQSKTERYFEDLTSTHGLTSSCGIYNVYVAITDTSFIRVHLDDEDTGIDTIGTALDITEIGDPSNIAYYAWTAHADSTAPIFCDCVVPHNMSTYQKWNMTEGNLVASVSKLGAERTTFEPYEMSVHLKDMVFDRSESGMSTISISSIIVKNAYVSSPFGG